MSIVLKTMMISIPCWKKVLMNTKKVMKELFICSYQSESTIRRSWINMKTNCSNVLPIKSSHASLFYQRNQKVNTVKVIESNNCGIRSLRAAGAAQGQKGSPHILKAPDIRTGNLWACPSLKDYRYRTFYI